MKKYKMAIMGAGNIARKMAETINNIDVVECYAVASRNKEKAEEFAKKFGFLKAYGSYEEMVKDPEVELVYIATPHSHHYDHGMLCIKNNKPILCEKSFMTNAKQAKEVINLAKEKNLLVAEAIWPRYMPMLNTIKEVLDSGVIGEVSTLTANLGYNIKEVPRLTDPNLAGGALLDVGVYAINFAFMVFGSDIKEVKSACTYTETGVDAQNSITYIYNDGKMAILNSSMLGLSDRKGIIYGTKGFVIVENINNFETLTVYDNSYNVIKTYERPEQITGFEYQVEACIEALEKGWIECPAMPHKEIINVMEHMDSLREEWNIKYPFEK